MAIEGAGVSAGGWAVSGLSAARGTIRLVSCFGWVGAGGVDGRGADSSAGISNSRPKTDNR